MMSIMNTLLKLKAFGHQPNLFKLSVSSKMSKGHLLLFNM